MMKFTAIFLLSAFLAASAAGSAQGITINERAANPEKVFNSIKVQTGYTFFYNLDLIEGAKKIDINVKNATIIEVLNICTADQKFTYEVIGNTVVIKSKKPASPNQVADASKLPPIDVRGRVVNEIGEPVNATVTEKGTRNATATDADGYFMLKDVAENATIIITSISIEQPLEVKVNGRTQLAAITVRTKVTQGEDVVVSTGYQNIPKERATGSFVQVDSGLLNRRISTNIIDRLQGIASGMAFNKTNTGGDEIRIRGVSTIFSNANPLIVVDNFPYDGLLTNINPNDIASITILKDAAAASIWGARAGNGVIIITSRSGRYNQPVSVQYSSSLTLIEKPDIFKYPNMTTSDFIDLETTLFDKGAYNTNINNRTTYPALSPVVEILLRKRRGQLSAADAAAKLDELRSVDARNEYANYAYRTGIEQQNFLSLSGGGERSNYFLSAGFDNNTSSLGGTAKRLTINLSNNLKLSSKMEANVGVLVTAARSTDNTRPAYNPSGQYPYEKLKDAQGRPASIMRTYRDSFLLAAEGRGFQNWHFAPLTEAANSNNKYRLSETKINVGLKYQILKGFQAEVRYQYDKQSNQNTNLQNMQSFYTRDLINRYTQLVGNAITDRPVPLGSILDESITELLSQSGRLQFNYSFQKGRNNLYALAGAEVRQIHTQTTGNRVYGYNKNTMAYQAVDLDSSYRLYPRLSARIPDGISLSDLMDRYRSFFGNAGYTYNSCYTFTASARIDASNYFGVKTNQRAVPLWSAGFKWDINKESFYNLNCLPVLKLRATYGYNGNINKSLTAYSTALNLSGSPLTNSPYAQIITPPNSALRWERVRMINLGVDFGLRNSIISGSIEYYAKKGVDLIGDYPLDPTIGFLQSGSFAQYRGNVATMKGQGIDIDITTRNIDHTFKWSTNFLFSFTKDKVIDYYATISGTNNFIAAKNTITPIQGKPLYAVYSYRWAGLDPVNGDPMGYLNGVVSKDYTKLVNAPIDQLRFHGSARPLTFGSLRNWFQYKQFSVSVNIVYKFAYYFSRPSVSYSSLFTGKMGNADYEDRWQKPGDENITNVPSLIYPEGNSNRTLFYNSSETLVEKGDHVRLQDINATYQLSFNKGRFRKADITLYANNLGIIWKDSDKVADPDYYNGIPPSRTIALMVKAYF